MIPLMGITLVSFMAFWIPPSSKERLSFGTILVACEVLIMAMLQPRVPIVKQSLLLTGYVAVNLYFTFGTLLISLIAGESII